MITELYIVYGKELLKYCYTICGNASDAEDLLQETFMRALGNLELLEGLGEKQRRAWLYKVARNIYLDMCRKRATERAHTSQYEEEIYGDFTEAETAVILSALPPELSYVFCRRYFEGYTSNELAEEYGMSPSGIRAMLSRARKILREKLSE